MGGSANRDSARSFVVAGEEAGRRLDVILADRLEVSRAEARRLLETGAVAVDGQSVSLRSKGAFLPVGAKIALSHFTHPGARRIAPDPELALRVLARGEGWLAADKPAGVAVHPLAEEERGTLLNGVAVLHPEVQGVGEGGLRSGVVHRLDVDTSGVLLVATEQRSWERLRAGFRSHRTEKIYRAVVLGHPGRGAREEVLLRVAHHRPARVAVVPAGSTRGGARRTQLSWRLLETLQGCALVEVRLTTGFLHQIRVTFANLGHPVAGDPLYGPGAAGDPTEAPRQMLHAARLALDEIQAESPDPPDLTALLERFGR